jgi:Excalibur calcium-binding domain
MVLMMKIGFITLAVVMVVLGLMPQSSTAQRNCDRSYPDVCIPSPPPDLDCGQISHQNFSVVGADPHRFDGDNDGIGCEAR